MVSDCPVIHIPDRPKTPAARPYILCNNSPKHFENFSLQREPLRTPDQSLSLYTTTKPPNAFPQTLPQPTVVTHLQNLTAQILLLPAPDRTVEILAMNRAGYKQVRCCDDLVGYVRDGLFARLEYVQPPTADFDRVFLGL